MVYFSQRWLISTTIIAEFPRRIGHNSPALEPKYFL